MRLAIRDLASNDRAKHENDAAWEHLCTFWHAVKQLPVDHDLRLYWGTGERDSSFDDMRDARDIPGWGDELRYAFSRLHNKAPRATVFGSQLQARDKSYLVCARVVDRIPQVPVNEQTLAAMMEQTFRVTKASSRDDESINYQRRNRLWSIDMYVSGRRWLRARSNLSATPVESSPANRAWERDSLWIKFRSRPLAGQTAISFCCFEDANEIVRSHLPTSEQRVTTRDYAPISLDTQFLYNDRRQKQLRLRLSGRFTGAPDAPLGVSSDWRLRAHAAISFDLYYHFANYKRSNDDGEGGFGLEGLGRPGVTLGFGVGLVNDVLVSTGFKTYTDTRRGVLLTASGGLREGIDQGWEAHVLAELNVHTSAGFPIISVGAGGFWHDGFVPEYMVGLHFPQDSNGIVGPTIFGGAVGVLFVRYLGELVCLLLP